MLVANKCWKNLYDSNKSNVDATDRFIALTVSATSLSPPGSLPAEFEVTWKVGKAWDREVVQDSRRNCI
jgi:hypothetical protein